MMKRNHCGNDSKGWFCGGRRQTAGAAKHGVFLDLPVQARVLTEIQSLLEHACYTFAEQWLLYVLFLDVSLQSGKDDSISCCQDRWPINQACHTTIAMGME